MEANSPASSVSLSKDTANGSYRQMPGSRSQEWGEEEGLPGKGLLSSSVCLSPSRVPQSSVRTTAVDKGLTPSTEHGDSHSRLLPTRWQCPGLCGFQGHPGCSEDKAGEAAGFLLRGPSLSPGWSLRAEQGPGLSSSATPLPSQRLPPVFPAASAPAQGQGTNR